MIYNLDYKELVNKINPFVFNKYLKATGWTIFNSKRTDIKIFQKKTDKLYQVTIPLDTDLADYKESLFYAVQTVAGHEKRTLDEMFLYLLNPNSDILKIRIEKDGVEAGSILLDDAIKVYENAKKLLGAAAQDVIKPAQYHQGRMDATVTEFLNRCRFGQTEVGSYIVSVICPMTQTDEKGNFWQIELFDEIPLTEESFTRRVTKKVMNGITAVKTQIDNDQFSVTLSKEDSISVNFYEALAGMNLDNEGVKVEIASEWAPTFPVDNKTPQKVLLNYNYYKPLTSIIARMKENVTKKTQLIGKVKKLEAVPEVEKRSAGKITLVYIDDNGKARSATTNLEKSDYDKAIEAHTQGWYVEVVGEMTGRRGEIQCESFNVI